VNGGKAAQVNGVDKILKKCESRPEVRCHFLKAWTRQRPVLIIVEPFTDSGMTKKDRVATAQFDRIPGERGFFGVF
jgi:hypothetical protein